MNRKTKNSTAFTNNVRPVDADHPDPAIISEACRILTTGGVVVFPAATLYGLAVEAFNPSAVAKVHRLKNRPLNKPLLLLVPDRSDVYAMADLISPDALRIMDRYWPGMVTLVLKAKAGLPVHLVTAAGTIGLRVPAHPVARSLVAAFNRPVTGTSANLSGQPGIRRADEINRSLAAPPDLVLDAGVLPGGVGSTVVDVTVSPPVILREGAVSAEALLTTVKRS